MSGKRPASRSPSRSLSQALEPVIERAPSSIAESDVSERELQRNICQTPEEQKSSETLIETYVNKMFNSYRDHNIRDYDFWTAISHDFADFKQEY
jgi:hypothetical protein